MSNETKNLPATLTTQRPPSVFSGAEAFESAQRMAKALVASNLVPKDYQGNQGIPNAMIALEMAQRIGASPMAVMQNLHVIHGRPSWSSAFIIASLNSCGRFSPVRFVVEGEGDKKSCYAWAYDASGERLEGPPASIAMAKAEGWFQKNGSKWQTMPELMLRYRAAAFFGRLYAPDILMGMHAEDEVYDMGKAKDVTPVAAPVLISEVDGEPEQPAEQVRPDQQEKPAKQPVKEALAADPEPAPELDRDAIKAELDRLDVEYSSRARTETLQQLLDEAIEKWDGGEVQDDADEGEAAPALADVGEPEEPAAQAKPPVDKKPVQLF